MRFSQKRFGVKFLLVSLIAASAVDAVQFNCVFDFYEIPLRTGALYACFSTVFSGETKSVEKVTGVHEKEYTHYDVELLIVRDQKINFVPKGIDQFFQNLKAVNFHSNNIFSISAEDLQPFPKLEYLVLYGNSLKSLDGDLFSYTPRLKYIHLGANKLRHIGENLLRNLSSLEYLNLDDNICIDESAYTREDIEILSTQLSMECPPMDETTGAGSDDLAKFREEIEDILIQVVKFLNEKVEDQKSNIDLLLHSSVSIIKKNEKLAQRINAVEKALLKVEKQQQEISSKMNG